MFHAPVTGATALHRAAQRGDEVEVAALLDQVRRRVQPHSLDAPAMRGSARCRVPFSFFSGSRSCTCTHAAARVLQQALSAVAAPSSVLPAPAQRAAARRAAAPQGADPTARDGEARTPLHHAVMRGHVAAVDTLLERGGPALLLAKDILGCTPVHLAAVQNQVRRHPGALGRPAGRLAGWLVGWVAGRLLSQLAGWLSGWLVFTVRSIATQRCGTGVHA